MYNSEYCKIEYIQNLNGIFCQWKKYCQDEDYKQPLRYGLSLIKNHNATIWITDTTNGFKSNKNDTNWLLNDFIPQAINSSCETIIFIMEDSSPLKQEIGLQAKALSQYFNVKIVNNFDKIDNDLISFV